MRFYINILNIAGHCCHGWHHVSNIKGTIGQHNRGEHDDGEFTVFMKSKHKHSGYRQSTLENDICILKTKRKIFFNENSSTKISFLTRKFQNQSISKSMEQSQPRLVYQLVVKIHNQLVHVAGQLVGEEWPGRVKSRIFYKKLICHSSLILLVLKLTTNVISNR